MPKYMIVHQKNPEFVSKHVNHFCKVCSQEKGVIWRRVNYNIKEGRIFCLWEAPDRELLTKALGKCGIPCEELVEVEEMTPEECCWDIFGEMEE